VAGLDEFLDADRADVARCPILRRSADLQSAFPRVLAQSRLQVGARVPGRGLV